MEIRSMDAICEECGQETSIHWYQYGSIEEENEANWGCGELVRVPGAGEYWIGYNQHSTKDERQCSQSCRAPGAQLLNQVEKAIKEEIKYEREHCELCSAKLNLDSRGNGKCPSCGAFYLNWNRA